MITSTQHQCGYCAARLPFAEMDAHIRVCEKHPLAAALRERDELTAKLSIVEESARLAMRAGSGHRHWDSTMQHGAGCEVCLDRAAANESVRATLDTLPARAKALLAVVEAASAVVPVADSLSSMASPERWRQVRAPLAAALAALAGKATP